MTRVLDHGHVVLVESWGSDERIIEAARMSTAKGFLGWGPRCGTCDEPKACIWCNGAGFVDGSAASPCVRCGTRGVSWCKKKQDAGLRGDEAEHDFVNPGDEKLLAFLWKNHHATPFEMAGMIIEVQAPIFVFREWHRHRTQSYNEMSARYTPLPDVNYVPTVERLMMNAGTSNKQAGTIKDALPLTVEQATHFQEALREHYGICELMYQYALGAGIPKELARAHLPVGRYSRMMASTNLRNWLAFLTLRIAPNAQWEIREYARAVHDLLAEKFPRTMELFDGR